MVNLKSSPFILETFRSEDKDDYEYEFSVLSMRIRFGDIFRSARAQNRKLVLVVVLVLRSKGPYWPKCTQLGTIFESNYVLLSNFFSSSNIFFIRLFLANT